MSKLIYAGLHISILLGIYLITPTIVSTALAVSENDDCPRGSYSIGDNHCKSEPTGCPYGDSIPIDSPKCVAPTETKAPATEPDIIINTEIQGGK